MDIEDPSTELVYFILGLSTNFTNQVELFISTWIHGIFKNINNSLRNTCLSYRHLKMPQRTASLCSEEKTTHLLPHQAETGMGKTCWLVNTKIDLCPSRLLYPGQWFSAGDSFSTQVQLAHVWRHFRLSQLGSSSWHLVGKIQGYY